MKHFNIGDIVRGTSDSYGVTNKGMTKARIMSFTSDKLKAYVTVEAHKHSRFIGASYAVALEDLTLVSSKTVSNIRGLDLEVNEGNYILTLGNQVIVIPSEHGIGVSSVLDGEQYVEEIGKALAFYRHSLGGKK